MIHTCPCTPRYVTAARRAIGYPILADNAAVNVRHRPPRGPGAHTRRATA